MEPLAQYLEVWEKLSAAPAGSKEQDDLWFEMKDKEKKLAVFAQTISFEQCLEVLRKEIIRARGDFDNSRAKLVYNLPFFHLSRGGSKMTKEMAKPLRDAVTKFKREGKTFAKKLDELSKVR